MTTSYTCGVMKRRLLIGALFVLGIALSSRAAHAAGRSPARQVALRTIVVYHDGKLARGWQDWSWAQHALAVPAPAGLKGQAMSVAYRAWDGIYLHSNTVFDTRRGYVQITLNGGAKGGQQLVLMLANAANHFGKQLPLDLYLPYGALPPRRWVTVRVPLTASWTAGVRAHGIVIQE